MKEFEKKWQLLWEGSKAFESKISKKPKFYLVFAYPTVSGTLHVGHARSYTIPDIIARYKRLRGHEVFFPIGFHATGVDCSKILEESKADPAKGSKKYGLDQAAVKDFKTPQDVDKYLEKKIISAFQRLGISIDTRTAVSTIDPHYNKFIQWQYRRLNEGGYLSKGSYVLPYCNDCQHVVSLDSAQADIAEGSDAEMKEYEVIKFKDNNGVFYPIATLRPETVFGVTNLWIHPSSKYVKVDIDGETWIISEQAIEKFENLGKNIDVLDTFDGGKLEGREIENPATGQKVKIIPADFVDAGEATGVVMSVPAHDPFDYKHYKDATGLADESIPLIVEMPIDGVPSQVLLEKHKGDAEAAVKELYRLEYRGKIKPEIPVIGGLPTPKAKEKVIEYLSEKGSTDKIYEFTTRPVLCRIGNNPIVIKKLSDQWFVNYALPEWKNKAKQCIEQMATHPSEYQKELPGIIDWLRERPVVRRRGLGTEFPFTKGQMIEALSDSTIYMAFYFISKAVNAGDLNIEEINDALFDYVYNGKSGDLLCDKKVADSIKKEFEYFYPLDVNFGGKEHKSVHFPFFIFHHSALFNKKHWPKGIFVNWHLIVEGEKMSKSKGNVIFWDDAIDQYGADSVRFYVAHGTNQWNDFDWKSTEAQLYRNHLKALMKLFDESITQLPNRKDSPLDDWMDAVMSKRTQSIESDLDQYELRTALSTMFFDLRNDIQWYRSRGGTPSKELLENWLVLVSPIIPHIAEEYWNRLGNSKPISTHAWPKTGKVDEEALRLEGEVKSLVDDLNNLMRIVKEKKKVAFIYTVKDDETDYLSEAADFIKERFGFEKVFVASVKDKKKYDPQNKAKKAKPGKPAIYLE